MGPWRFFFKGFSAETEVVPSAPTLAAKILLAGAWLKNTLEVHRD